MLVFGWEMGLAVNGMCRSVCVEWFVDCKIGQRENFVV